MEKILLQNLIESVEAISDINEIRLIQKAIDKKISDFNAENIIHKVDILDENAYDLYSIKNFSTDEGLGFLNRFNGIGYYGTESKVSQLQVILGEDYSKVAKQYEFTHIYWFWNKSN